jgi:hypothetical protein
MALQMNYIVEQYQLTINDCYWKVEIDNGIVGGKEKLRVRINCFKTKEIADTNQNKYFDYDFEFVPDLNSTENFIAQAYAYAKTLPFFATAIDA